MNEKRTFWECVYDARTAGLIPRVWSRGDLSNLPTLLERFSRNTINTLPSNESISREGNEMGISVKQSEKPKAWRVGRGKFQLVEDPDDDADRQDAQRELARKRAQELVSQARRDAALRSGRLGQLETQTMTGANAPPTNGSQVRPSDMYESVSVALNDMDLREIAGLSTERKALYIVKKHIRSERGEQAVIEEDRDGADLRISVDGQIVKRVEVKGTSSPDLAWSKLKVSSQRSHDALKSGEAEMYRVVGVDGARPSIYILTYGRDFTLEPEPRWAVKRAVSERDRYPLRGRPYRYEQPYDPVAQDEWEALE